jgi:hypothetical protein
LLVRDLPSCPLVNSNGRNHRAFSAAGINR